MEPPRKAFKEGDTVYLDTTSDGGVHVNECVVTDARFDEDRGRWQYEIDGGPMERERSELRRPDYGNHFALL